MSDPVQRTWPEATSLYLEPEAADAARLEARDLVSWDLTSRQLCDVELLLAGALAPLDGYLGRADFDSVVANGTLANGVPMPWPISLDVDAAFAERAQPGSTIALRDSEGLLIALLDVTEAFEPEAESLGRQLFHGGVPYADSDPFEGIDWLAEECRPVRLAGRVRGVDPPCHYDFNSLRADPTEVHQRLQRLGWRRLLAVVTAGPIGPGEHAVVTATARDLEANVLLLVEGGMAEPGDVRYYARLRALEHAAERFSEQTTELVLVPLAPPLGSSRERGLRHLVARNYGATHLLLLDDPHPPTPSDAALDHALDLETVPSREMRYLPDRGRYRPVNEVPTGETALRCDGRELVERLCRDEEIPGWLGWPEQVEALRRAHPPRRVQGFTLFLTGLSGSGKSTVARALLAKLMEEGSRRVTLLDGDIVRKNLSSELGFSREHRDLNILRIGFVASEITKNGGVAICAPIAPYAATRRKVRSTIEAVGGFVEIHVATPLDVCESRDRKGLYAKARAGLIKEFTGISDPYETPGDPELRLDTTQMTPDEAAQQIMLKLVALGYL